jgi:hypothetical protein
MIGLFHPADKTKLVAFARAEDSMICLGPELVDEMGWRVYSEWCCSRPSQGSSRTKYNGEGFRRWIDDETHYLIESTALIWDPRTNSFRDPASSLTNERYEIIRDQVLRGSLCRATEFFCSSGTFRPEGDGRDLRTSLRGYIH